MLKSLFEKMLTEFLGSLLTEEKIKQYAELLRGFAYRAIDMGLTALVSLILNYMKDQGGVILSDMQSPAEVGMSLTTIFAIISVIRYVLGWR